MPEETEEKSGWLETYQYMRRLRHGPPPDEMEVLSLVNTFHEFIMIQLLATSIKMMEPADRDIFVDKLRKNWKRSLRRHINEQVVKHEEQLKKAPDAKHLRQFLGDGESMRMDFNEVIKKADEKIEEMLGRLVEQVSEGDDA